MLVIYTDGGCLGNPGPGGWAFAAYEDGHLVHSSSGGDKETTNNKMELSAVINAIQYALDRNETIIEIFTDSQYVKNGITTWISGWKRKGWTTASGTPVKNREYWEVLDKLNGAIKINWSWVKGHAGVEGNELCDSLVRKQSVRFQSGEDEFEEEEETLGVRKNLGPKSWMLPCPVLVVGTYDGNGNADAMTAAWGGVYNTNKVIVCIDKGHKSFRNIEESKALTLSFATYDTMIPADYVGLVSQHKDERKIEKSGLTPVRSEFVNAPIFKELTFALECSVDKIIDEECVVCKVENVSVDETILTDGQIDVKKMDPIIYEAMNHNYWSFGKIVGKAFKIGEKLK